MNNRPNPIPSVDDEPQSRTVRLDTDDRDPNGYGPR